MRAFPRARIVAIEPMRSRDVHLMVEVRRPQLELPVGYFTSKALARLDELCAGNPRRLDALLFRSRRLAIVAAVARVSPGHVEQAALQIATEAGGSGETPAFLDRDAARRLLRRAEEEMESGRPWQPRRAEASDFWARGTATGRHLQTAPAASAWPPGKPAVVQGPARRAASALTTPRKAGLIREKRFLLMNPMGAVRGGPARQRPGYKILVAAGVATLGLAVTALSVKELLPWAAGDRWIAAGPEPTIFVPLSQAALPSASPGAFVSPSRALAATNAKPVLPAPGMPFDGGVGPVGAVNATGGTAAPQPAAPTREVAAVGNLQGAGLLNMTIRAGPRTLGASPAGDGPSPPALPVAAAPSVTFAAIPAPEMEMRSRGAAPAGAALVARVLPRSEPASGPKPPISLGTEKEAARLLSLGTALLGINQVNEAKRLIKESADMGGRKAAALLAVYDAAAHVQNRPSSAEGAGRRIP